MATVLGRVGGVTYKVDRSKMSSARVRQIERAYMSAKKAAQAEADRRRVEKQLEKLARKRELLAAEDRRRPSVADLTAAERGITRRYELPRRDITPTGAVSTTFAEAVRVSRKPLAVRRAYRAARREEAEAKKLRRKLLRQEEEARLERFPEYVPVSPEVSQRELRRAASRARRGEYVKTPYGPKAFRALPPGEEGGPVRAKLGRALVPLGGFGGAMAEEIRPEAAQRIGFERLFRRRAERERVIGRGPPEYVPPKIEVIREKPVKVSQKQRQEEAKRLRQLLALKKPTEEVTVAEKVTKPPDRVEVIKFGLPTEGIVERVKRDPLGLGIFAAVGGLAEAQAGRTLRGKTLRVITGAAVKGPIGFAGYLIGEDVGRELAKIRGRVGRGVVERVPKVVKPVAQEALLGPTGLPPVDIGMEIVARAGRREVLKGRGFPEETIERFEKQRRKQVYAPGGAYERAQAEIGGTFIGLGASAVAFGVAEKGVEKVAQRLAPRKITTEFVGGGKAVATEAGFDISRIAGGGVTEVPKGRTFISPKGIQDYTKQVFKQPEKITLAKDVKPPKMRKEVVGETYVETQRRLVFEEGHFVPEKVKVPVERVDIQDVSKIIEKRTVTPTGRLTEPERLKIFEDIVKPVELPVRKTGVGLPKPVKPVEAVPYMIRAPGRPITGKVREISGLTDGRRFTQEVRRIFPLPKAKKKLVPEKGGLFQITGEVTGEKEITKYTVTQYIPTEKILFPVKKPVKPGPKLVATVVPGEGIAFRGALKPGYFREIYGEPKPPTPEVITAEAALKPIITTPKITPRARPITGAIFPRARPPITEELIYEDVVLPPSAMRVAEARLAAPQVVVKETYKAPKKVVDVVPKPKVTYDVETAVYPRREVIPRKVPEMRFLREPAPRKEVKTFVDQLTGAIPKQDIKQYAGVAQVKVPKVVEKPPIIPAITFKPRKWIPYRPPVGIGLPAFGRGLGGLSAVSFRRFFAVAGVPTGEEALAFGLGFGGRKKSRKKSRKRKRK